MDAIDGYLVGYLDDYSHLVIAAMVEQESSNDNAASKTAGSDANKGSSKDIHSTDSNRASQAKKASEIKGGQGQTGGSSRKKPEKKLVHFKVELTKEFLEIAQELFEAREYEHANPTIVMFKDNKRPGSSTGKSRGAFGKQEVSDLRPQEIQKRLRSGELPEEVAKVANTSIDHIMRWYETVKMEQNQVISIVQNAVQERSGCGFSKLPIGRAMLANLKEQHPDIDASDISWKAVKYDGREYWTVTATYGMPSGYASRVARWKCLLSKNLIEPIDEHARSLGWVPKPGAPTQPVDQQSKREALGIEFDDTPKNRAQDPTQLVASRDVTPMPNHRGPSRQSKKDTVVPIPNAAVQKMFDERNEGVSQQGSPRTPTVHNVNERKKYRPFQNYERPAPPDPRRPL